jgi:hypothetical protein
MLPLLLLLLPPVLRWEHQAVQGCQVRLVQRLLCRGQRQSGCRAAPGHVGEGCCQAQGCWGLKGGCWVVWRVGCLGLPCSYASSSAALAWGHHQQRRCSWHLWQEQQQQQQQQGGQGRPLVWRFGWSSCAAMKLKLRIRCHERIVQSDGASLTANKKPVPPIHHPSTPASNALWGACCFLLLPRCVIMDAVWIANVPCRSRCDQPARQPGGGGVPCLRPISAHGSAEAGKRNLSSSIIVHDGPDKSNSWHTSTHWLDRCQSCCRPRIAGTDAAKLFDSSIRSAEVLWSRAMECGWRDGVW